MLKGYFTELLILFLLTLVLLLLVLPEGKISSFFSDSNDGPLLPPLFLLLFAIINGVSHVGYRKMPEVRVLYTLTVVSLKFLLPAIAALVWFVVLKNNTNADVILFFIVYLSFTLTTVFLIIRNLKNQIN
jgi:hypothetical protein